MSRLLGSGAGGGMPAGRRTLVVLVCASIVLVTLYSREGASGPVHVLRSAVQTVAAPFAWAGSQLLHPLDLLATAMGNATADEGTLEQLREENATLTAELAELGEYKLENERLRQIVGLASAYGTEGVGARVVGFSSDDWSDTVTVDKGAAAGVEVGMPVTDGNGVVGQVSAVAADSATVTLLSDPGYQVGALLQNSRTPGVLQGSVDGSLHLAYVPAAAEVEVGELVVTSGLGGAYPKGLLIGTVASVTSSPSDVYCTIVVEPAASVGNLEEVYIITSYDVATADEAAETLLETGSLPGADAGAEEGAEGGDGAPDAADDPATEGGA